MTRSNASSHLAILTPLKASIRGLASGDDEGWEIERRLGRLVVQETRQCQNNAIKSQFRLDQGRKVRFNDNGHTCQNSST